MVIIVLRDYLDCMYLYCKGVNVEEEVIGK